MTVIKIISENGLFKTTRRKLLFVFVILTFAVSIYKFELWPRPEEDISCYYAHENDSLPFLDGNESLPSRSIFFYVTSCPGNLSSRQSCAIESASKTHPEWQINVIFLGPVLSSTLESFAHLQKISNVKFWRIDIAESFEETPFLNIESWYPLKYRWGVLIADILKYLTLYTWGGIYLELDVVVARPLGSLVRNWATRDSEGLIDEGILALSRDSVGRNLSLIAMMEINSMLRSGDYDVIRPVALMRALQQFCFTPVPRFMSSENCRGFELYGPQFFHPIPKNRAREYFTKGDLPPNNAYIYHLWEDVSNGFKIPVISPYANLAKRYCPITFKMGIY